MNNIEEAITQWWGERCPETFPGCPCCDAWIEYDALLEASRNVDFLRYHGQKMHRRAQKAEGKSIRSTAILNVILERIKNALPKLPPIPYPISMHILYGQIIAARDHAKNNSGAANSLYWSYYGALWQDEKNKVKAADAKLERAIAALKWYSDDQSSQGDVARGAIAELTKKPIKEQNDDRT